MIEQLSLDLSNYCSKGCKFCYNKSNKNGTISWTVQEVLDFSKDCIKNGTKAISLGGGEPFEYDGIFEIIKELYQDCYITATSNGLPLENPMIWEQLVNCKLDKLHISIHSPQNPIEVKRVLNRLNEISKTKIKPGLNLLVGADNIEESKSVFKAAQDILNLDQIILIPQRYGNTPSAKDLAKIADGKPFQCPSCLLKCSRPKNFCSVSCDKRVNYCSYAQGKVTIKELTYKGLTEALESINWEDCIKC